VANNFLEQIRDRTITQVAYMPRDSHFLSGLVKVKSYFLD
jgi:hypothetical protein